MRSEPVETANGTVVIEEYLDGPEVSLFVLSDGSTVVPLAPAQDFKRIFDNDEGPNTGGMGAYSPVPLAGQDVVDEVDGGFLSLFNSLDPAGFVILAIKGRQFRDSQLIIFQNADHENKKKFSQNGLKSPEAKWAEPSRLQALYKEFFNELIEILTFKYLY